MMGFEHIGPRFAEWAVERLAHGDIDAAVALCRAGIRTYPRYATGYLILGRCYESQGKPAEALIAYRDAARLQPGIESLQAALQRVTPAGTAPPSTGSAQGESAVEYMLRQLQQVKQRMPPVTGELPGRRDEAARDRDMPIVSATIAEILVQQGEYKEAVATYRRLIRQRPDEAGRHSERLAELERLLQGIDKLGQS